MKYQDIENRAKKIFSKDTEPVDTAALISALDLPVQPKRKRFTWLVLVGLAVIGLGVAALWLVGGNAVSSNYLQEPVPALPVLASKQTKLTKAKPSALVTKAKTSKVDNRSTRDVEGVFQEQDHHVHTTIREDQEINGSSLSSEIDPSTPSVGQSITTKSRPIVSTENRVPSSRSGSEPIGGSLANSEKRQGQTLSSSPGLGSRDVVTPLEPLPTDIIGEIVVEQVVLDINTDKVECPTFGINRGKLSWSLIPEVGVMAVDNRIEGSPTDTASMIRMQDEEALEGLQAALYVKASHSKLPIYLRSGLSYSRIAHRMALNYQRVERDTTQGIISLTTSPTGDTITAIIGDIVTETTIAGQSTRHYYTHQWDVPIALGVEQAFGKWIVGAEAGVNINVRTTATGSMLRTADAFSAIENNVDISTTVGLGYFGGVQVGRQLEGFGEVYLAARIRHIPDVSANTTATTQQYMLYGLHAGYVYPF